MHLERLAAKYVGSNLLIQGAALGIGDRAGRVLRLDLIIDQRIEHELARI
jgi:hypothetical protein